MNTHDFIHHGPWVLILIATCALLVFWLVIALFVCWLLYGAFERIPARFRRLDPGLVWLLVVPCFGLIWNFVVFPSLARSFKAYFDSAGDSTVGDCGEQVGLFFAVAAVCMLVPCLDHIAFVAAMVLLVVYLVKVQELKRKIPPGAA